MEGGVPQAYLQGLMIDYYRANVNASASKIVEIECATRGQGTSDDVANNLWLTERRKRITSSTTGTIARRRSTTKAAPLVKTLLYSTFGEMRQQRMAMSRSQPPALPTYKPGISTQPSGLVSHPECQWLAASPDDLVNDTASPDPLGIVQYKNPFRFRSTSLIEAAGQAKDFCLTCNNGFLSLKRTHIYYYQVQVTMFCTQR